VSSDARIRRWRGARPTAHLENAVVVIDFRVVGKSEAGNHFCLTSGSPVDSLVVTSNTLENVSDKILRFPESVAPLCVCGASGLCSDDFVERLALFL
jgi:hypothetical protein